MRIVSWIIALVYLLVGVAIAANKDYFVNVNTLEEVLSAILAVVLWPLLLLGVDMHLGDGGDGRNGGNGGNASAWSGTVRSAMERWFA